MPLRSPSTPEATTGEAIECRAVGARSLQRWEARSDKEQPPPSTATGVLAAQEAERRQIARALHDELGQLRAVALGLWPTIVDDLGLPAALRWLAQRDGRRDVSTIGVEIDEVGRLPSEVEIACFRVAQEALTNAMRHAGARAIDVRLRASAGESLGLAGMHERVVLAGGRFELEAAPGKGTIVRASLPIAWKETR
jgi:signal transduction histidine kinase